MDARPDVGNQQELGDDRSVEVERHDEAGDRDPLPIEIGLAQSQRSWSAALAATPVAVAQGSAGPQLIRLGDLVERGHQRAPICGACQRPAQQPHPHSEHWLQQIFRH